MTPVRPVSFRGGDFRIGGNRWAGFLVFALLIAVVEVGIRQGWIGRLTLRLPSDVLEVFRQLWIIARNGTTSFHRCRASPSVARSTS